MEIVEYGVVDADVECGVLSRDVNGDDGGDRVWVGVLVTTFSGDGVYKRGRDTEGAGWGVNVAIDTCEWGVGVFYVSVGAYDKVNVAWEWGE